MQQLWEKIKQKEGSVACRQFGLQAGPHLSPTQANSKLVNTEQFVGKESVCTCALIPKLEPAHLSNFYPPTALDSGMVN